MARTGPDVCEASTTMTHNQHGPKRTARVRKPPVENKSPGQHHVGCLPRL